MIVGHARAKLVDRRFVVLGGLARWNLNERGAVPEVRAHLHVTLGQVADAHLKQPPEALRAFLANTIAQVQDKSVPHPALDFLYLDLKVRLEPERAEA